VKAGEAKAAQEKVAAKVEAAKEATPVKAAVEPKVGGAGTTPPA